MLANVQNDQSMLNLEEEAYKSFCRYGETPHSSRPDRKAPSAFKCSERRKVIEDAQGLLEFPSQLERHPGLTEYFLMSDLLD
jgi:hypothetical protein